MVYKYVCVRMCEQVWAGVEEPGRNRRELYQGKDCIMGGQEADGVGEQSRLLRTKPRKQEAGREGPGGSTVNPVASESLGSWGVRSPLPPPPASWLSLCWVSFCENSSSVWSLGKQGRNQKCWPGEQRSQRWPQDGRSRSQGAEGSQRQDLGP